MSKPIADLAWNALERCIDCDEDASNVEELCRGCRGAFDDIITAINRALAAERRRIRASFRREVLHGGVQWASVYTSTVMRCVRAPRAGRGGGGR